MTITSNELRNGYKRWSKRDLKLLKELYGTTSYRCMSKELHRTRGAISFKASQLGLAKSKPAITKGTHKVISRNNVTKENNDILSALQVLIANGAKISIAM